MPPFSCEFFTGQSVQTLGSWHKSEDTLRENCRVKLYQTSEKPNADPDKRKEDGHVVAIKWIQLLPFPMDL